MIKTSLTLRRSALFVCLLLAIEFLDEVVFSAREAALPLIRDDLGLSYDQIGLLLSLPIIFASIVEPILFTLSDVWRRKWIILGGGVVFGVEVGVVALAQDFATLLVAMVFLAPASGAFVSISQAALMDTNPHRHESLMAQWTLAGSVGVVAGPLGLGAMIWLGYGWRELFGLFAVLTALVIILAIRFPFPRHITEETPTSLKESLGGVWHGLCDKNVLRWLILLDFSDLLLDVLLSYLALYMVDVAGVDAGRAGIAVAVWTGVGLLGDALLIPLLERVNGLSYLRLSVWIEMILFPVFLLIPSYPVKLCILALLGFFNSGWYAILQGQLYSVLPGRSGTALTLTTLSGLLGSLLPLGIGLVARRLGLEVAIWLLMAGPLALMVGLPRQTNGQRTVGELIAIEEG